MLVRTIKNADGTYTMIDTKGNISKPVSKEALKKEFNKSVFPIDLKIDKGGRLVYHKVDYKCICRKHDGYKPLEPGEQERILFYGLARINQLTEAKKVLYLNLIMATKSIDEADLISLFTDNRNWNAKRFWSMDTQCRDKIIDLMYRIADARNRGTCYFND